MKLNIDFRRLERARESINASKAELGRIRDTINRNLSPIEVELLARGSRILTPEELNRELHFPTGIAAIGNTQITLHIFQPLGRNVCVEDLQQIPAPAPRYHIADCRTLEEMRQRGRFNRYVATVDSDGNFRVVPWNSETRTRGDEMPAKLAPCQNCLRLLNYDGFQDKTRQQKMSLLSDFDIQKFFKNYEPIFRCLPLYNPDNFPAGNYTADWASISETVRIRYEWKCQECSVDLSDHRHLLHVHHKDGIRGNNKSSNLKPLCCVCHQKQPHHQRMNITQEHQRLIKGLVDNNRSI